MSTGAGSLGVFDSGLGGLTVLKEILRALPDERAVYFGDTARVPYGTKSKETITRFSAENIRFLRAHDPETKMIVIACHTASSLALDEMRRTFDLPVVGVVEPGAQKAVAQTRNGRIGIIGTKSTIGSGAYERAVRAAGPSVEVYGVACPLFVSLIEEGWTEGEVVEKVAEHYLKPLRDYDVDTVILGCTHYPILEDEIRRSLPDGVKLVNPAEEVAKLARTMLADLGVAAPQGVGRNLRDRVEYFVSDEPESFRILGQKFLGHPIPVVRKVNEIAISSN